MDDLEIIIFGDRASFERWLAVNGESTPGIWMKIAKRGAPQTSISYQEALEIALCYGWIDGQKKPLDADYWLQRFTPRKARSIWSQINKEKVQRLIAEGRMQAAGLKAIAEAKANGRWDSAYQPTRSSEIPAELKAALELSPRAWAFFQGLDSRNRFAFIFRIQNAKQATTKAAKVAQFIAMMEQGQVFYPKK